MSINPLTIGSGGDVFNVGIDGFAEEIHACLVVNGGIRHGLDPGNRVVRDSSTCLSTSKLEASDSSRLISRSTLAIHLVVGELDNHLNVSIGRALELLDEALSVTLIGLNGKLVLADDIVEVLGCAINLALYFFCDI